MIKAVIFDMDGVLINSEPVYFHTFVKMIEEDGHKVDREDFKSIVGKSHEKSLEMIGAYYDGDFNEREFFERFEEIMKKNNFSYKDILFPYVVELLDKLQEDGYKLALASSSLRHQIDAAVKECGIEKYFSVISSGEDFHETKPNPEIYLTTANKLGLKPEECIAVEDSFSGIKSAKNAGMKVVAKKDTEFNINQEQADFIVDDLKVIPAIINLINSNKTEYEFEIFEYSSKQYLKSLFLRNEGLRKEFNLNVFRENLEDEKDDINLGVFHNGQIIGTLGIRNMDGNTAQLTNIVVDREYRKNGLGVKMIEFAEEICKTLGYSKLFLKAREKVVGFYESNDFILDSEGYKLAPTNTIHYNMTKNI